MASCWALWRLKFPWFTIHESQASEEFVWMWHFAYLYDSRGRLYLLEMKLLVVTALYWLMGRSLGWEDANCKERRSCDFFLKNESNEVYLNMNDLFVGWNGRFPWKLQLGMLVAFGSSINEVRRVVKHISIAFYKSLLLGSLSYFHRQQCLLIFAGALYPSMLETCWIHLLSVAVDLVNQICYFFACVHELIRRYIPIVTHIIFG